MAHRNGPPKVTRRRFVAQALAATSAAAFAGLLPRRALAQTAPECKETLRKIGEIKSQGGKMKGIITCTQDTKNLAPNRPDKPLMRYFASKDQQSGELWPPAGETHSILPGPTLRLKVGERAEISFLNKVDVGKFPNGGIDNQETGRTAGCDPATNAVPPNPQPPDWKPDKDWYPKTRGDSYPNCFHGSSTGNLHFHGTHVTPDGFGDNVLIQMRPDPNLDDAKVLPILDEVFNKFAGREQPPPWAEVPESYRNWQEAAVKNYDLTAIWEGVRGPKIEDGKKVPVLPYKNQLWPVNEEEIKDKKWPQYYVGGYPNMFVATPKTPDKEMGQAPGTHWYHSHKHGSTSINLYNGLAGVLIIEGDYDAALQKIYPNLKTTAEKVMIVQRFTDLPNLERVGGRPPVRTTNGSIFKAAAGDTPQTAPVIMMRPGEIQLWRIVNGTVEQAITGAFTGSGTLPKWRQIAADGVQFSYDNFVNQPLTSPSPNDPPNDKFGTKFTIAAGNRIDILVKAPGAAGQYYLSGVCNLIVCGNAASDPWPTSENYPVFPPFLKDIEPPLIQRTLTFDWEQYRVTSNPAGNGTGTAPKPTHSKPVPLEATVGKPPRTITVNVDRGPYFMIDRDQFSEHRNYQLIMLGSDEEWLIKNTTNVAHPFHIHVNPFQIIQIYDPNNGGLIYDASKGGGIWQDVIAIPAAKNRKTSDPTYNPMELNADGYAADPGWVRIRHRFVDFPGTYVLHCHILAHEDRGMMQLVKVERTDTPIAHH